MLYLLRHAKAMRDSPTGRDIDRALAPRGIEQARFIAFALGRRAGACPVPPARLVASPALRAAQTAGILGVSLGLSVEHKPQLAPNAPAQAVTDLIAALMLDEAPALIVGHNPTLEDALALATHEEQGDPHIRTGELITLEPAPLDSPALVRVVARLRMDE
ncbi:MAG: histidine phosphatase family protein [Phycisphaerales bacterium]|nr:histidine phosphatase family protein [Phycisphaerales bacterium]